MKVLSKFPSFHCSKLLQRRPTSKSHPAVASQRSAQGSEGQAGASPWWVDKSEIQVHPVARDRVCWPTCPWTKEACWCYGTTLRSSEGRGQQNQTFWFVNHRRSQQDSEETGLVCQSGGQVCQKTIYMFKMLKQNWKCIGFTCQSFPNIFKHLMDI